MDFKLVDQTTNAELFIQAQGKDNHTQLSVNITAIGPDGEQYDFSFDENELYYVGHMINKETGFEIFNLREIYRMSNAEKEAWEDQKNNK